ncbi:zinc finger protein [Sarracenia purpurea var. burkii]
MTMDVYQRTIRADSSPPISVDDFRDLPPTASPTSLLQHPKKPVKPAKRSFDVAFLMAPDDLSKKRHHHDKTDPVIVKKPYKYSPPSNDTNDLYHRNVYSIDGQYQIYPLSLTIHHDKVHHDDIIRRTRLSITKKTLSSYAARLPK